MLRKNILLAVALLLVSGLYGQETIKTMFYNVFNYPSAPTQNREAILADILAEYDPDIFMVCEIESEFGANNILNNSLNITSITYERAPYFVNQSSTSPYQQMVYFKSSKFSLEKTEVIVTTVRDINRYQLKLLTPNNHTDPVYLDLYVAHLKSSTGPANRQLRLDMVSEFTATLSNLDPNSYVIFAGDLNLYNASEPAYQELLDPTNPITLADPLGAPGAWQDNPAFAYTHTQSTRLSNAGFGGGAGAGLDDRFDFILISENMLTDPQMQYVPNSYKAFGNNGNCLNNRIDSMDCDGFYDQALRSNLYFMSDHLPVVMDIQTDLQFLGTTAVTDSKTVFFPKGNIVNDNLMVQVHGTIQENVSFDMYNILGQKINHIPNSGNSVYNLDTSALKSGVYYLVTGSSHSKTYKFLKR